MPDASIMLELCELLKINVNELLTGERIIMDNYKKAAEENLVEMKTKEERTNKKMSLVITVCVILLLFTVFAGIAGVRIGGDLGVFFYNISH